MCVWYENCRANALYHTVEEKPANTIIGVGISCENTLKSIVRKTHTHTPIERISHSLRFPYCSSIWCLPEHTHTVCTRTHFFPIDIFDSEDADSARERQWVECTKGASVEKELYSIHIFQFSFSHVSNILEHVLYMERHGERWRERNVSTMEQHSFSPSLDFISVCAQFFVRLFIQVYSTFLPAATPLHQNKIKQIKKIYQTAYQYT